MAGRNFYRFAGGLGRKMGMLFDFRGGAPRPGCGQGSQRTTTAAYFDSTGYRTTGSGNGRFLTGLTFGSGSSQYAPGVLSETEFTNAASSPEDLLSTGADWSAIEGFAFENRNVAAPDGSTNGTVVYSTSVGEAGRRQTLTGFGSANQKVSVGVCISGQADSETIQWACVRLQLLDGATQAACYFNPLTGAVGTASNGAENPFMLNIGEHGGETWYYCGFTVDLGAGATAPVLDLLLADADNNPSSSSVFGEGIVFWGVTAAELPYLPMYTSGSHGANDSYDMVSGDTKPCLGMPEGVVPGAVMIDFTPLADAADLVAMDSQRKGIFNTDFTGLAYIETDGTLEVVGADLAAHNAGVALTAYSRTKIVLNFDGTNLTVYANGAQTYKAACTGIKWGIHASVGQYVTGSFLEPGVVWHQANIYNRALSPEKAKALSVIS